MKRVKKSVKRRMVKRAKAKKSKAKIIKAAKPVKLKIKRLPKRELSKYRDLLIKEREKIGGGINHITQEALKTSQRDASGDLSGYSFHMADVASDNYEMEFSLGRASDEQDILYTIDEALKRIDDGTYGSCTQCGKQIPKKRLSALPHTELCIKCQSSKEVK